ncbi:MAG: YceI family protein [Pseudomonadota bacterium]
MRSFLTALLFLALPALADPVPYTLDAERSSVAFSFELLGGTTRGTMPVEAAQIALDFDTLSNSRTDVTLDAAGAATGFGPATAAMRGSRVLDTEAFPTITFTATDISGTFSQGRVTGLVTIKGVTRPVTMDAQVLRQAGTAVGDLSRLTVRLTGQVDRHDFGVDGYRDLVGPIITLDITTRLNLQ